MALYREQKDARLNACCFVALNMKSCRTNMELTQSLLVQWRGEEMQVQN